MEFHDVLHGPIRLGLPFNRHLIEELLATPEVARLRNMRLMNFDVPLIQELASAKRLSHSVGVCYLAQEVGARSLSSQDDVSTLMVAALLHDAAIPPYGHLVEALLKKSHPDFDHSRVLRELLFGTYHITNIYHQIVPGVALELSNILDRFEINPDKVLKLVQPDHPLGTAISAQIDLDNIDNIHRMASLIGWKGARTNLRKIVANIRVTTNFRLEFKPETLTALEFWQDLRQRLYTLIIAHPRSVAQNAFQSDLVRRSIEQGVMTPATWYINEPIYEENLRNNCATRKLANQLLSGSTYRLVDYVWFTSVGKPPCNDWGTIFEQMEPNLPLLNNRESYFSWVETGLIARTVNILLTTGEVRKLGVRSSSCLIARIHTEATSHRSPALTMRQKSEWRSHISDVFRDYLPGWQGQMLFPEDYSGTYFRTHRNVSQLKLC